MTPSLRHLVSVDDLDLKTLAQLILVTARIKEAYDHGLDSPEWIPYSVLLRRRVVGVPFYEASTRTNLSSRVAAQRLGADDLPTDNAGTISSAAKGEGVAAAAGIYSLYVDALVQRHPCENSAALAAEASHVPFINAGAGAGEHPTQALLDIFTIWEHFGGLHGKTLTVVGDLKYGRTVHSLVKLVARFKDTDCSPFARCILVSPESLQLPEYLETELEQNGMDVVRCNDLSPQLVRESDVIYMTRTQKERAGWWHKLIYRLDAALKRIDLSGFVPADIVLTEALARQMRDTSLILHPLPKGKYELPDAVDRLPQAQYMEQARNGLFTRMALLIYFLRYDTFTTLCRP